MITTTPLDPAMALSRLLQEIINQHGFLQEPQLEELVELDRLRPVLIRCSGGRFTCPAQDAKHFIEIIEATTVGVGEYVRDVSLPTTDETYRTMNPQPAAVSGNLIDPFTRPLARRL